MLHVCHSKKSIAKISKTPVSKFKHYQENLEQKILLANLSLVIQVVKPAVPGLKMAILWLTFFF